MHALAKITNLSKICQSLANIQMAWRRGLRTSGDSDEYGEFGENGEFGEDLPSVSENSNEMAKGAMTSGKVDFWTYM